MIFRFHAPVELQVCTVTYISGDTWNVDPIALERMKNLYCKERTGRGRTGAGYRFRT